LTAGEAEQCHSSHCNRGAISLAEARTQIKTSNPQGRIVQPEGAAAPSDFFCSDCAPGFTSADVRINADEDWQEATRHGI